MVSQYQTIWTYSDSKSPNRFLGTFSLCSHCHINCLLFFHVFSSLAPVLQHVSSINFPSFCQALQWCRSRILSFWRHVATRVTTAVADHETQLVQDHSLRCDETVMAIWTMAYGYDQLGQVRGKRVAILVYFVYSIFDDTCWVTQISKNQTHTTQNMQETWWNTWRGCIAVQFWWGRKHARKNKYHRKRIDSEYSGMFSSSAGKANAKRKCKCMDNLPYIIYNVKL